MEAKGRGEGHRSVPDSKKGGEEREAAWAQGKHNALLFLLLRAAWHGFLFFGFWRAHAYTFCCLQHTKIILGKSALTWRSSPMDLLVGLPPLGTNSKACQNLHCPCYARPNFTAAWKSKYLKHTSSRVNFLFKVLKGILPNTRKTQPQPIAGKLFTQ